MDHGDPDGPTIDIDLVRLPATGEARGSIFVNPGGPGASGVGYVRSGFQLDPATSELFHLVGFDPRGVGGSEALNCQLDRSDGPAPDFSPDTPAEQEALDTQAETFAQSCAELDTRLLPHLDTESVARDLDVLRRAVGDDELHYLGFSFGTLIGILYADLFPERVGHLVLDGVVDPTFDLDDLLTQQTEAFNRVFAVMDRACADRLDCPEGGIIATHDAIVKRLEEQGPVDGVGSTEAEAAALASLYSERLWPGYALALRQARDGDYSRLGPLGDFFLNSVSYASYAAVVCTDSPRPTGPEEWDRFARDLESSYERFGATIANELRTCAYWPIEGGPGRSAVAATGAKPILVVGTTNDPATPLSNAVAVAEALDDGRLVVFNGDTHTAYGSSPCVQRIVTDYFVDDVAPTETVSC